MKKSATGTYRRTRTRRVRTIRDAALFIESVGFCLLFASTQSIELPSLFEAVKGRRDAHIEDWDADSDRVWTWKNELPADRRAYYGKALAGGKPVLVSLKMLPYLYAVAAPQDPEEDYAAGRLSLDAKRVVDALRVSGPTPVQALRRAAGYDRPDDGRRYHRALDDLQRAMVILPVGATLERGAWMSQIYDLVPRWFPRSVTRAARVDVDQARRALVRRYVQTVVAAKPAMIARVFGWPRASVNSTIAELISRRDVTLKKDWLVVA